MAASIDNQLKQHVPLTVSTSTLFSFVLAILFCTQLRFGLLLLFPIVVLFCFVAYRWNLSFKVVIALIALAAVWLLSFRLGIFLKYNLVSLYYIATLIILLFAAPVPVVESKERLRVLMNCITGVVMVNNVFGVIQYINFPNDDSFEGLYGRFTVTQNGLSIVNGMLFVYYFIRYQSTGNMRLLWLSGLFLICSILGFYGAGLIVLLLALPLTFFRFSVSKIFQAVLIIAFIGAIAYYAMRSISPNTLNYNLAIIERFIDPKPETMPRKLLAIKNYFNGYGSSATDLLLGSGPGTFNSRSAFMVGSPSYFDVGFIKQEAQPPYFQNYAYPLWNATNTGPYDGFMNQPFSSLFAMLGEYGLLFTILLVSLAYSHRKTLLRPTRKQQWHHTFLRFVTVYLILLISIDNYLEYPEITGLLLIIATLCIQQIKSTQPRADSVSN
jgi:hypothetical protein